MITADFIILNGKTYQKEAFAIGFPSSDAVIYCKGAWSKGTGYRAGTPVPAEALEAIRDTLIEVGFDGVQVLPVHQFTMADGEGNVYGCEAGGVEKSLGKTPNPSQPLAYESALTPSSIHDAVNLLQTANRLTPIQTRLVHMALAGVRRKAATQRAYQITEEDVREGRNRVVTKHGDHTEAEVEVPVGGWVVLQANGEVQYVEEDQWEKLGFQELP